MIDRTTKALLFAIALGLWLHLAGDLVRPVPVHAQVEKLFGDPQLRDMAMYLKSISQDTTAISSSLRAIEMNTIRVKP